MEFNQFTYKNVSRNAKAYFAYFLSICISSALFFSFSMFLFHPNKGQLKSYINIAIFITEIIAYLFLSFFVFYSISVFLKSRYKEFGILYITGISKKQLHKMLFLENIIINSAATLSGIILGLIFSKIYLRLIEKFFNLNSLNFYFPVKAIIITLTSFILLGVLVSLFTSFIIRENEVLKLLKATKAPKPEPKSFSLLALLGLVILLVGYYMSLTARKENLEKIMLPVVAMVVFATYLLFSQFSVFFIKLLKKNRQLYLKNTNLLWISNLFYKLKDNSRMFFLVAITSTVAFTSIGTCFAFWKNTLGNIEKRHPYAFVYSTFGKTDMVAEETGFLEDILKKENYNYKKVVFQSATYTSKDNEIFTLISESTYRGLADLLNIKPLSLNENEAIQIPFEDGKIIRGSIKIENSLLSVTQKADSRLTYVINNDVYVVNNSLFDRVADKDTSTTIYIYQVNNWAESYEVYDRFAEKYGENSFSLLLSKSHIYESEKRGYGTLLFLTIFIGVIFFVASGSFIYNRFYMDEEADKRKYMQLNKIGLTYKEIKKIVTFEIGTLFLIPFIVAVIHSSFALTALKNLFEMEVTSAAFLVMGSFLLVQILYFLFIRGKYLSEMREQLTD
ncbi:FtsX-like permease family protein [Clostridium sp. BSD9I1]|uniref:FtsX-like permease family protein n=1 Tax=Clostridium sp. BSD9I1 TaxID=2003589 RepID=UPI0016489090|nr:ABC transporter permease [Clostridium sp. BSD9I1]